MRILILHTISDRLVEPDDPLAAVASNAARPDTEIVARGLAGVPSTAYAPAEHTMLNQLLSAVVDGAAEGFDAIVIGCASDPGLSYAKTLVDVPVTAPFEAATQLSAAFGRLAVLYPGVASGEGENLPQDGNWARRLAHRYGALDRLAGALPVSVQHPTDDEVHTLFARNPAALSALVLERMRAALHEHGIAQARHAHQVLEAEAIFCSCTFWSGMLDPLADAVPIPVIDPIAATVAYAESLVIAHSFARRSSCAR